jgi:hypothetical protein
MIAHMHHIGMVISNSFDVDDADPAIKAGLDWAVMNGLKQRMLGKMPTMAKIVNGWLMNTDAIGVYGNYYLKQANFLWVWLAWVQINPKIPFIHSMWQMPMATSSP